MGHLPGLHMLRRLGIMILMHQSSVARSYISCEAANFEIVSVTAST